jgi:hypothetical protein
VTDAERNAELEEALRQRDARIAEFERLAGELYKVIEALRAADHAEQRDRQDVDQRVPSRLFDARVAEVGEVDPDGRRLGG